jgi:hypothetical protein
MIRQTGNMVSTANGLDGNGGTMGAEAERKEGCVAAIRAQGKKRV